MSISSINIINENRTLSKNIRDDDEQVVEILFPLNDNDGDTTSQPNNEQVTEPDQNASKPPNNDEENNTEEEGPKQPTIFFEEKKNKKKTKCPSSTLLHACAIWRKDRSVKSLRGFYCTIMMVELVLFGFGTYIFLECCWGEFYMTFDTAGGYEYTLVTLHLLTVILFLICPIFLNGASKEKSNQPNAPVTIDDTRRDYAIFHTLINASVPLTIFLHLLLYTTDRKNRSMELVNEFEFDLYITWLTFCLIIPPFFATSSYLLFQKLYSLKLMPTPSIVISDDQSIQRSIMVRAALAQKNKKIRFNPCVCLVQYHSSRLRRGCRLIGHLELTYAIFLSFQRGFVAICAQARRHTPKSDLSDQSDDGLSHHLYHTLSLKYELPLTIFIILLNLLGGLLLREGTRLETDEKMRACLANVGLISVAVAAEFGQAILLLHDMSLAPKGSFIRGGDDHLVRQREICLIWTKILVPATLHLYFILCVLSLYCQLQKRRTITIRESNKSSAAGAKQIIFPTSHELTVGDFGSVGDHRTSILLPPRQFSTTTTTPSIDLSEGNPGSARVTPRHSTVQFEESVVKEE